MYVAMPIRIKIMKKKIELLAPAKNLEIGIEAIKHGADAVYIGADRFSAREAAGNSVEDIAELVRFAHIYNARVYVAINTVLTDEQLPEAEKLIHELYNVGVDAIIVQDMGVMKLNLPPIELHASTQTDNRDVEKVNFLYNTGFSQVVLARECSLNQIKNIAENTDAKLEVFVHGALCVSYSGQCYVSESIAKRSANRGSCAQFCRLPYDLVDADGNILAMGKHLLSLKDLNQSDFLEQLLDAGVSSLKIEGRLKDMAYVKNIVSLYRQRLDAIFKRRPEFRAASSGKVEINFTPDAAKSFNRGFTNYYLNKERAEAVHNPDSPKSIGEPVGTVKEVRRDSFTVAGIVPLHNGDGLCFKNERGQVEGFRVNRVEDNRVFPAEWPSVKPKTPLYRNFDHEFDKVLQKETAKRKVSVDMRLSYEQGKGFVLEIKDEDGLTAQMSMEAELAKAKSPQRDKQEKTLSKLGNTPFEVGQITMDLDDEYFIPMSGLADLRRDVLEELTQKRIETCRTIDGRAEVKQSDFPQKELSYLGNVTNKLAYSFYQDKGVAKIDWGFEIEPKPEGMLMLTKHCVKYAMGWCPKWQKARNTPAEPLLLKYKDITLRLEFDCKACEMKIFER